MALLYHSIATVVMAHRQYAGRDQITRIPTLNTIMIGGYSGRLLRTFFKQPTPGSFAVIPTYPLRVPIACCLLLLWFRGAWALDLWLSLVPGSS